MDTLTSLGINQTVTTGVYCDLTVNKTIHNDSFGTLKSAIGCAVDGDTIYIDSAIAGMTIDVATDSIVVDKNIIIRADPSDNIKVSSSGSTAALVIASGKTVSIIGLDLEDLSTTSGVIKNYGTLTIKDLDVVAKIGSVSISNENGANLHVEGDCNLQEN